MELVHHAARNDIDVPLDIGALAARFDTDWWDGFLAQTGQMTTPEAFRNCIDRPQTARMRRCVLDIIAQLANSVHEDYGYRVWIDGQQLKNLDEHFTHAPRPGEDIEDWTARAFGERKFGIILNRGEKFNHEFSRAMAYVLRPLFEKMGMPTEGFLFTIFIGNYNMTPLGIHKDLPGKSVMHFHLGPGPKTMYVWDDERYVTAPGVKRQNNMDFHPHLDSAIRRTFHEGDIYFMPENKFHLGTQEGLSIGVACWSNNRSNRHFAERLLQLVKQNYLKDSEVMLKSDRRAVDDLGGLEQTLDLFSTPGIGDVDLKEMLRYIYKDFRYALFSNAGFRNSPFPDASERAISDHDRVQIEDPYRMLYLSDPAQGSLTLYVRGTKLSMRDIGGLRAFIDAINGGHEFSIAAVLDILGAPWSMDTCKYLVALLRRHRGIRVL